VFVRTRASRILFYGLTIGAAGVAAFCLAHETFTEHRGSHSMLSGVQFAGVMQDHP